jgi:transposase
MHRNRYDDDFKKNAVKLSYASSKSVSQVAGDLGISPKMLYNWRTRYTVHGDQTMQYTLEQELKALRLENAELKMERDMLKKAAAFFAKQQK